MRSIRSKNTKMELLLAKSLWSVGIRYRKNDRSVFGTPDLTIKKYKIAIFVDSEFFHGKNWEISKYLIKTNSEFWVTKISNNIKRDKVVNDFLSENGWKVIRFWSNDVKKNIDTCIGEVLNVLENRKNEIQRIKENI